MTDLLELCARNSTSFILLSILNLNHLLLYALYLLYNNGDRKTDIIVINWLQLPIFLKNIGFPNIFIGTQCRNLEIDRFL